MTRPTRLALALALILPPALLGAAQAQQGGPHHPGAAAQPEAGAAERRIKALSEEQVAGLLEGRGMGLAMPAELNGYPGPMHVLELAEALGLTPDQRRAAETLRAHMLAEARPLGARIVALEQELDALFAGGAADAGRLAALTSAIGALRGRLREAHLATHIAMREALDPAQRATYARLRGHAGGR